MNNSYGFYTGVASLYEEEKEKRELREEVSDPEGRR
jgi:hypothetical protein